MHRVKDYNSVQNELLSLYGAAKKSSIMRCVGLNKILIVRVGVWNNKLSLPRWVRLHKSVSVSAELLEWLTPGCTVCLARPRCLHCGAGINLDEESTSSDAFWLHFGQSVYHWAASWSFEPGHLHV